MHGEGFLFVNINMNDDGGYVQHAKTKELYWPMVVALLLSLFSDPNPNQRRARSIRRPVNTGSGWSNCGLIDLLLGTE